MVNIPVQKQWHVGDVVTAADLNSNFRDGFDLLLENRPLVIATEQFGGTTHANGVWTTTNLDTQEHDSDGAYSGGTTITIQTTGLYVVSGCVSFLSNANGDRLVRFERNGTPLVGAASLKSPGGSCSPVLTRLHPFQSGDALTMQGYQNSGVNLGTRLGTECSYLEIFWFSTLVGI